MKKYRLEVFMFACHGLTKTPMGEKSFMLNAWWHIMRPTMTPLNGGMMNIVFLNLCGVIPMNQDIRRMIAQDVVHRLRVVRPTHPGPCRND
jgi:hypothetical protein